MGRTTYLHAPSLKWLSDKLKMQELAARNTKLSGGGGFKYTGDTYKEAFAQDSEKATEKENIWQKVKRYLS